MIVLVVASMLMFRGAGVNTGLFPYGKGAFASHIVGDWLSGFSEHTNEVLEHIGLLLHIGIMLVFLIQVLNSKHLHIFLAPLNVLFSRRPNALGSIKPIMINGKPLDPETMEDLEEEDFEKLGVGKVEDFSWKGMLDFATCTECGRCQSQCPAWNTEKPLSPKLLIMGLRDHAFAKAPYTLADSDEKRDALPDTVKAEAERALVGPTEGDAWHPTGGAVIDPDVLWSCVSCGACVEQCPVDIEHVDHIMDMRRYQVIVESNFPAELTNIFKGLERKGNPWGMDPKGRMDWAKNLDFEVKQVGVDVEDLDEVDWLFWVGCAGAYEDRAKKTTQAVAELLDMAGVTFAVLGDGETCTGDPARRAGNEIVFQQLAMQNAEVFKETKVKKVVSTCAHCFNTLKNEYAEFGVELEVVHHTQLLNRLVREGKLTPLAPDAETEKKKITYHDPCFIGRHNKVYEPPRELLSVIPGAEFTEMPRNSREVVLLWRRWCADVDGRDHRHAHQRQPHEGSRRDRRRPDRGCLPVLPRHAVGRSDRRAERGQRPRRGRGARRRADAARRCEARSGQGRKAVEGRRRRRRRRGRGRHCCAAPSHRQGNRGRARRRGQGRPRVDLQDRGRCSCGRRCRRGRSRWRSRDGHEDKERSDEDETVRDVPAGDKEEGAWANVGAVNTDGAAKSESLDDPVTEKADESNAPEAAEKADASTSDDEPKDETPDVPAGDKEEAAWANVGAVNTDDTPAKEPEEAPAEKVTHVPDETEPVEEDAREEEAEESDTEIKDEAEAEPRPTSPRARSSPSRMRRRPPIRSPRTRRHSAMPTPAAQSSARHATADGRWRGVGSKMAESPKARTTRPSPK